MHFKQFDLTLRMLQHTFPNVRRNVKSRNLLRHNVYHRAFCVIFLMKHRWPKNKNFINFGLGSKKRNNSLVSKEIVILRRWGSETREFHIKRVDIE